MGAWPDREAEEEIEEDVAGEGKGGTILYANPGEKIQLDFERTDGGANNEPWLAGVKVSMDPGTVDFSDPLVQNIRLPYDQVRPSTLLSGYYAYEPWVYNDDPSPLDKVKAKLHARKDGVSL